MQAKRIVPVRRPLCKVRRVRIFSASSGGFCIVALDKVPAPMILGLHDWSPGSSSEGRTEKLVN